MRMPAKTSRSARAKSTRRHEQNVDSESIDSLRVLDINQFSTRDYFHCLPQFCSATESLDASICARNDLQC